MTTDSQKGEPMNMQLRPEYFEVMWDSERTFPFFEDENATGVYGYGHTDKAEFAANVNEYDLYTADAVSTYTETDVLHGYAVVDPEDHERFKIIRTPDVPEGATPITYVVR